MNGHAMALATAVLFAGVATNGPSLPMFEGVAAQETVDADLVKRGAKLARRSGCATCHSLDGSRRPGPTWKGLTGRSAPSRMVRR